MAHPRPKKRLSTSDEMQASFDPFAHALTTISEDHNMIHQGRGFTCAVEGTIVATATETMIAKVPAGTFMHWRLGTVAVQDTPCRVELRDSVLVSADGTPLTAYANARIDKTITPDSSIFANPTITDAGTLLIGWELRDQGGGPPGQPAASLLPRPGGEWVWTNDNITISITNNSATSPIAFEALFFWYELDANYQLPELDR